MIYFDNSATGGFKPASSILATEKAIKFLNANPGRGSHRLAVTAEEFVYKCRSLLSKTFNNQRIERVIFTKNCTEALNIALFGLLKDGDEVVTTVTEHNSVLRPLYALERQKNITIKFAQLDNGKITASSLLQLVSPKTKLVVMNAVSNVTGAMNDFREIAKSITCPIVLDCAQLAGHQSIDLVRDNISAICVAGHKGLYSVAGIGALIFRDDIDIEPLTFGGSGTDSFLHVPEFYPEKLESGSLNLPAICSLYEGVDYAYPIMEQSEKRLLEMTRTIISALNEMGVKTYSEANPYGIVAFELKRSSVEIADILSSEYDIAVRGGFHCAPLMHCALKTQKKGLVRASLAFQNTQSEIRLFLNAIYNLKQQESGLYVD